jgi:hypothetical protein
MRRRGRRTRPPSAASSSTNLARPAERVVAFYNHRGTCEQYIKEGKSAIKRQAARARRVAEAATTRAVKARLLDDADHYDELAANADRAGTETEKR